MSMNSRGIRTLTDTIARLTRERDEARQQVERLRDALAEYRELDDDGQEHVANCTCLQCRSAAVLATAAPQQAASE